MLKSNIILLAMLVTLAGCCRVDDGMVRGRRTVNAVMDQAESIMDDDARCADSLMHLIDSRSIRSKAQKARYALLYTAAEYKNYQPMTSDSLIMEAVRYYSISNNLDYRFLSFYYLGCVYEELNQYSDAAVAFTQSEQLVDLIDNDFWKGLLYSHLGVIFREACDYKLAIEYYTKSNSYFDNVAKEPYKLYALFDVADCKFYLQDYRDADSIMHFIENRSLMINDSLLYLDCFYGRLSHYVYLNECDSATAMLQKNGILIERSSCTPSYLEMMALYYNSVKEYDKSESYLERAWNCNLSETDSIYLYYVSSLIAEGKGEIKESLDFFRKYTSLQNKSLKTLLNQPITGAQKDYFRTVSELEAIKARNRVTVLVASIMIFLMIITCIFLIGLNLRRKTQQEIKDYLSTIENLTAQDTISQGKISMLNAQVREMLRQQFVASDYVYTRYYEQIDDNKKAERLFRVIKSQIDQFTAPKSISRIDELLNKTFDGIMDKVLSSKLDLKEKEMLLLRFILTGFSAKSIAAILGDTHVNINQRKKRLLDKISFYSPSVMEELRIALNAK